MKYFIVKVGWILAQPFLKVGWILVQPFLKVGWILAQPFLKVGWILVQPFLKVGFQKYWAIITGNIIGIAPQNPDQK